MKSIAFTGDSHFDGSPNGRLSETVRLHDWMCEEWNRQNVGLVLHGGDLFEGLGSTSSVERLAAARFLRNAASCGPVLLVRGNHDPLGELPLYEQLRSLHPITVAESVRLVRFEHLDVEVVCVPWPRKGLAIADAAADATADVRESIRRMMTYFGQQPRKCSRRLLVSHAMISAAKTSTGQPLTSVDCEIAIEDLALAEPDVILLSHVHARQEWRVPTPSGRMVRAYYAGSPGRTDFGEMEEKSYVLLEDLDDVEMVAMQIPTPALRMLHLEATWDGKELVHTNGTVVEGPAIARLRVTIPDDQRDAARLAIATYVTACGLAGVEVKVEEIPVTTQRARAPEMVAAVGITEKSEVCWKAKGLTMDPARRERVLALALDIDNRVRERDPRERARRGGGIRLRRVRGHNVGPFTDFDVDFDNLKGPVVAVTGVNEAGKSTFLELAGPGVCYRTTITRDPLGQLATAKDAQVEGWFDTGGRQYRALHAIGRNEVSLTDQTALDAGQPWGLTPGGKVTEFDAWVEQNLAPFDVFEAAQFSAQGDTGFLGLGAAMRKELIQKALGIDGVEARAKEARDQLTEACKQRDTAKTKLDAAEVRAADVGRLSTELGEAQFHVEQCRGAVTRLEEELVKLTQRKTELERAWAEHRNAMAELRRAREAADMKRSQRAMLKAQIQEAQVAVDRLPAYETHREFRELDVQEMDRARGRAVELKAEIKTLSDGVEKATASARAKREARARADRKLDEVRAKIERAAAIRAEAAKLTEARKLVDVAKGFYAQAKDAVQTATRAKLGFATGRATNLREGHVKILRMTGIADVPMSAVRGVSEDSVAKDDAGLLASDASRERALLEDETRSRKTLEDATTALHAIERAAAALDALGDLQKELADAEQAATLATTEASEAEKATDHLGSLRTLRNELAAEEEKHTTAWKSTAGWDEKLKAEPADRHAASRLPELLERERALPADEQAVAADPDPPALPPNSLEVDRALALVRGARTDQQAAERAVATLETRLSAARAAEDEARGLRAEFERLVDLVSDLNLLVMTFGRDGIQALEVDAAVPELTAIVNDLLHSCFSTRWTVRLDTTKPVKGDPSKVSEGFIVRVTDGRTGIERDAKSNSGGAKVPISDAISFALTVIACGRSGVDRPTLVRDESGASLDQENGKAYMAMLRRAAERVGAEHVLLVSHNRDLHALADSRLRVGGGTVTIE